jgi:hypothetical protein
MKWASSLLLLMSLLVGCASMESSVPKKTILMSENSADENWQPSKTRKFTRSLRGAAIRGFTIKVEPTRTDSFNIGAMKSKAQGNDRNNDGNGKGKYFVGLRYTKKF